MDKEKIIVKIARWEKNDKTQKGSPYSRIQTAIGAWINVSQIEDLSKSVGRYIEITRPEKIGNNDWAYFQAWVEEKPPPGPSPGPTPTKPEAQGQDRATTGRLAWIDYVLAMKAAHRVAMDLEPDDFTLNQLGADETHGPSRQTLYDRSQARAALVNTAMIALSQGRIDPPLLEADDEPPEPGSDEPPWKD